MKKGRPVYSYDTCNLTDISFLRSRSAYQKDKQQMGKLQTKPILTYRETFVDNCRRMTTTNGLKCYEIFFLYYELAVHLPMDKNQKYKDMKFVIKETKIDSHLNTRVT